MSIPSPIDELSGNELAYIQRGLSQLDLILQCKDRRIIDLDNQLALLNFENSSLKSEVKMLKNTIVELQMKLEEQSSVTINDLETQMAFEKLFQ